VYNCTVILLGISFIAGILTVLAPCVLPLLPVIVGGSVTTGSRKRAYTICISLGASVILFTLLLKASTALINIPQEVWQWISGGVLMLFGASMLFPRLWNSLPFVNTLNRSSNQLLASGYQRGSLWGDIIMGAALGPVFASCSPTYFVVLATVLPASFFMGLLDLLAYAVGLSGFLLIIALAGQKLVDRLGITIEPGGWFRRALGVLFLVVGLLIVSGVEKRVESWLLERGFDATRLELRLLGGPEGGSTNVISTTTSEMQLSPEAKALLYPKTAELVAPDGYINTGGKPITIGEFKGKKVVLVDIWTYSCINCQRTLPYLKIWYEKYEDQGLEIIGVHTPEFAFEKVKANVEKAAANFGLRYPIILDNEYKTWNAFGNQFWPRKYLIDIDGFIVYDHAGEGAYEEAEAAIQAALRERARRLGTTLEAGTDVPLAEAPDIDFSRVQSPEVYFGSDRNEYLGNGTKFKAGVQTFPEPERIYQNTLYLVGRWDLQPEFARTESAAGIRFYYSAKDVYFVASSGKPVRLKITRDGGKPLGDERGSDVNENGYAIVGEERLYKLIEGDEYAPHILEITIEGAGLEAYTFTFG